jgi:FAD/FMN-containing dehydrogenase
MLDETAPHGRRYYDKLHYLPEVGDAFIDALLAGFAEVPTPHSHVMTSWMGGAIDRVTSGDTAFGHRGARAFTWLIGCGEDSIEPAADWVRRVFDATAPFASAGVYVNALDAGRPVHEAYAEEILKRLIAVKRRYDPDGVFDAHGIRPS